MINREKYADPGDSTREFNKYCLSHQHEGVCTDDCKCTQKSPCSCYYEWLNLDFGEPIFSEEEIMGIIKNELDDIKLSEKELKHLTSDSSHTIKLNEPEMVNHPEHYNQGGVECIDAIKSCMSEEAYKGFLHGNALKYLYRCKHKGKMVEDLDKAIWYINKLKEELI